MQAEAGHRLIESTRVYLHLTNDWLAGDYRRAAALIDADTAAISVNARSARCIAVRDVRDVVTW